MKVKAYSCGENLKLAYAILVYQQQTQYGHVAFVTKHPAQLVGDKPMIMPGMPMTDTDYDLLVADVTKRSNKKEEPQWNDPTVLARTPEKVIWWNPPTMQSMFFAARDAEGKNRKFSGVCKIPGLVFVVNKRYGTLFVYAVRGKERPTPETVLYQAPFHNVYNSGEVCIGNGARPDDEHWSDINAWVRMFFASRFTHTNAESKLLLKGPHITDFWEKQIKQAARTFPEKVLVELNIKTKDLLAKKH